PFRLCVNTRRDTFLCGCGASLNRLFRYKHDHAADTPRYQRSHDHNKDMCSGVKPGFAVASATVLGSADYFITTGKDRDDNTGDDDRLSYNVLDNNQHQ